MFEEYLAVVASLGVDFLVSHSKMATFHVKNVCNIPSFKGQKNRRAEPTKCHESTTFGSLFLGLCVFIKACVAVVCEQTLLLIYIYMEMDC